MVDSLEGGKAYWSHDCHSDDVPMANMQGSEQKRPAPFSFRRFLRGLLRGRPDHFNRPL